MRIAKYALVAALFAAPAFTIAQAPAVQAPTAQKPAFAQRQSHQQQRIARGFRNGSLNMHQTTRLERQHRNINRQMRSMRVRHNGRLTPHDRRVLNHRQNVASRRIFRAKHSRIG